jgi:hypothetical protein
MAVVFEFKDKEALAEYLLTSANECRCISKIASSEMVEYFYCGEAMGYEMAAFYISQTKFDADNPPDPPDQK